MAFDIVTVDAQIACARFLKWLIDRCTMSETEIAIAGWGLRYPFAKQHTFLINGKPFEAMDWPLNSEHLAAVFSCIPQANQGGFVCRHSISKADNLYPNGFARFDFVTEHGRHARSYRHAWFQPDPNNAPPVPEGGRVQRVIGVPDVDSYVRGGATIACRIDEYLQDRFGRSLSSFEDILDWGCGCARVTRHLISLARASSVTGVDIDADNVAWCRANVSGAEFEPVGVRPPTRFAEGQFDLAVGISVFTHLAEDSQFEWLAELVRITRKDAILLMSVQGPAQVALQSQYDIYRKALEDGFFDFGRNSDLDGFVSESDYYRAIIHSREYIYSMFGKFFDVLDIVDAMAGNQDLVVMRRR